jgi:hypothetical protein
MFGLCRRFAGIFIFAAMQICFAAPATTPISDVLYNADGTTMTGVVVITWPSFIAADGTEVQASSLTVTVTNGNFQVGLIPTTNAQTTVTYSIQIVSDGRDQTDETWGVPPSTVALTIAELVVTMSSPGGVIVPVGEDTTVTISDVVGLANELSARPVMGVGFTASRAAVIDSTGAISAAAGDPSDCVLVDGTSGPCGSASSVTFVDAEVPGGTVDGSNTQFSLSQSPAPAASLILVRNGLIMQQSNDYTLTAGTVTFQSSATPQPGDVLQAWYRVTASGSDAVIHAMRTGGAQMALTAGTVRPIGLHSAVYASLPSSNIENGDVLYCSDCRNGADDSAPFDSAAGAGGHGTMVLRENGAWRVH